ncbi:MAG: VOC family protein [Thermoanaerobaculia bacterium]
MDNDAARIELLNDAVEAILSGAASANAPAGSEIAALIPVAAALRGLPRDSFKARLKEDLMTTATMTGLGSELGRPPEGFRSITPHLVVSRGAEAFLEFVKTAFGAKELVRSTGSLGMHAQFRIDDSIVMIGGNVRSDVPDAPAALHFYVPDADTVYERALEAGATSIKPPVDQPYGDREAGVKDPAGNTWWIATHLAGPSFRPEGFPAITPFLHPRGAAKLIDFLAAAFGASEVERAQSPDGVVHHATVRIGDSMVEMGEAHGDYQPLASQFYLYVADCDAVYRTALGAGATSRSEPADQPYGDRSATVEDGFGNTWFIAARLSRKEG